MASTIGHEAACRAWALASGCISSINDGMQSTYGDMLIRWIGGVSPGMYVRVCVCETKFKEEERVVTCVLCPRREC